MTTKKVKVMHVVDALGIGGMERMLINLVNRLDVTRFEQVICCVSRPGEAAGFLRPEVRCFDMGKGAARAWLMPRKIARLIRAERPAVIHTRAWSGVDGAIAQQLTRLLRQNSRLVHSEHGRFITNMHTEPLKSRIVRRLIYQRADAVFAVSAELRDHYCRATGFARERMQVISNGVEVTGFAQAEAHSARAELGLSPADFVIGMVARMNPPKDLLTLARAFAHHHARQPERRSRLLLVGDGVERAGLEQFIAAQELQQVVRLTGARHDVPRLLKAMNVFALSSLSEGLSCAILEAMCAGLPVVATAVGANPELVIEGETGFLVAAGDAEAMSERFHRLAENPEMARHFGLAGRRRVEREYSLEAMVSKYEELYLSLAAAAGFFEADLCELY